MRAPGRNRLPYFLGTIAILLLLALFHAKSQRGYTSNSDSVSSGHREKTINRPRTKVQPKQEVVTKSKASNSETESEMLEPQLSEDNLPKEIGVQETTDNVVLETKPAGQKVHNPSDGPKLSEDNYSSETQLEATNALDDTTPTKEGVPQKASSVEEELDLDDSSNQEPSVSVNREDHLEVQSDIVRESPVEKELDLDDTSNENSASSANSEDQLEVQAEIVSESLTEENSPAVQQLKVTEVKDEGPGDAPVEESEDNDTNAEDGKEEAIEDGVERDLPDETSTPEKPNCHNGVVIVGNGRSVLEKSFGAFIDSCKMVVRFDLFKTKGYEKHVGTRVTHWGLASSSDPDQAPEPKVTQQAARAFVIFPKAPPSSSASTSSEDAAPEDTDRRSLKDDARERLLVSNALAPGTEVWSGVLTKEMQNLSIAYDITEEKSTPGLQLVNYFVRRHEYVYVVGLDNESSEMVPYWSDDGSPVKVPCGLSEVHQDALQKLMDIGAVLKPFTRKPVLPPPAPAPGPVPVPAPSRASMLSKAKTSIARLSLPPRNRREVVIVGNGRSVLGSHMGKTIDTFKRVVRFNLYVTKGFEVDSGRKTTDWVLANIKDPNDMPLWEIQSVSNVHLPHNLGAKESQTKKTKDRFLQSTAYRKNMKVWAGIWKDELSELKHGYGLKEKHFSSGLQALFYFAKQFKNVYFIGFDFETADHQHYWETKVKNETCHDMEGEATLLQKLVGEGLLKRMLPAPKMKNAKFDKYNAQCKILCDPEGNCKKYTGAALRRVMSGKSGQELHYAGGRGGKVFNVAGPSILDFTKIETAKEQKNRRAIFSEKIRIRTLNVSEVSIE